MSVAYRQNGGLESSGGSGPGASSTDVSVTQFRDSSGGSVSAGDSANSAIRVNVVAGAAAGSSVVTVSTGSVRVHQSTAADLNVTVAGYSTVVSVANTVTITPAAGSTFAVRALQSSAADFQATVTPVAGSTWAVRPLQSSAADLQVTATPAAGSTFNVRPLQSSAADLQATVTPVAGSTWRTQPGSTAWASSAGFHFDVLGALAITTVAALDSTFASGSKASSGDTTIISSAASTRFAVCGYHLTIDSTTPTLVRLLDGSTNEMARWQFRAPSSISVGANLAVSMPSYLYRTAVANALVLNTDSTATVHYTFSVLRMS